MGNKILFVLSIIYLMLVPIGIGIKYQSVGLSFISALCGALLLLVSKAELLEELSFGPLKAKLRQTIEEANATLDQLKSLAKSVAKVTLTDVMAGGFGGSMQLKDRLDLHDQLIENLNNIGLTEDEIQEADEMWRRGIGIIYHRAIRSTIERRESPTKANLDASPEAIQASNEFEKLLVFENWKAPTPDEMKRFLEEKGFLNEENQEWIKDYRHFLETGEIRRRELFVKQ